MKSLRGALVAMLFATAASVPALAQSLPAGHPAVPAASTSSPVAKPRSSAGPAASGAAAATARPSTSASASPSAAPSSTALPPGHPPMNGASGGMTVPKDTSEEDPKLAAGTIVVDLRDPDDKPLPNQAFTLAIVHQSVAKGEKHEHLPAITDAEGRDIFTGKQTGSNIAYRVTVDVDGGTFAAMPFRLPLDHGIHVVLHVYPVGHDLQRDVVVVSKGVVYLEMKDDRMQAQEAVRIFNAGRVAWVPRDVILALPPEFTALNSQKQMSDQGVDAVPSRGAKLRGTFGPGESMVVFSWQLPYAGTHQVDMDIGAPPNAAAFTVRAAAAQGMKLVVDGFPTAMPQTDQEGGRMLVTGRQLRQGERPMRMLHISLQDLPTPGPGRIYATIAAGLAVALGIYLALQRKGERKAAAEKSERVRLLEELEQLERARTVGDVGPRTYERAHRELVDELARWLARKAQAGEA